VIAIMAALAHKISITAAAKRLTADQESDCVLEITNPLYLPVSTNGKRQ